MKHVHELIQAYVDGELPAAEAQAVREHCRRCEECAAALREAEVLWSRVEEGAAPELRRSLWPDLAQRLPGSTVVADAGAIRLAADATVETELQRFEADPSGAVELAAQVAFRFGPTRPGVARTFRFSVPVEGQGPSAVAAAMSGALGRLADAVAAALPSR